MARKFFYVCAGMLMLALCYQLGVSSAGASAGAVAPTEIAVRSGALLPGEVIPLPTYADGTVALESECQWTVSLASSITGNTWCYTADADYGASVSPGLENLTKEFLESHRGRVVNTGQTVIGHPTFGVATYFIIATRSLLPTSAQRATFGQVKARYAPTTGTPTSETNDR